MWLVNVYLCLIASVITSNAQFPLIYPDYRDHPCARECDGIPKICKYELHIEEMQTMEPNCGNCSRANPQACMTPTCIPADGNNRNVIAINRMIPGPQIRVCHKDKIEATVYSDMLAAEITIHWHGQVQKKTPWYDGVPWVTQCPIVSGSKFVYKFEAETHGTHWYHSHSAIQRTDGFFAPLIVRRRDIDEPHRPLYDFDFANHTLVISEWSSITTRQYFFNINRKRDFNAHRTGILVNNYAANDNTNMPYPIFEVTKGKRYRFRLINGAADLCPIEFRIEGHAFTIISTDGMDIKAVQADVITTNPGERVDFIINANQDIATYKMVFTGISVCAGVTGNAILSYEGATTATTVGFPNSEIKFNCLSVFANTPNCILFNDLESLNPNFDPRLLKPDADHKEYVFFDTLVGAMPQYQGFDNGFALMTAIHNITYKHSPTPLISKSFDRRLLCNKDNPKNYFSQSKIYMCTHLVKVPLNKVIEFILSDMGTIATVSHPFHLHGTHFAVMLTDKIANATFITPELIMNMDITGQFNRNFKNPPMKDTLSIPDGGVAIFRFVSKNPGYWLMHCHVERHSDMGMALVVQVGDETDILDPPRGFPLQCGDWNA